MVPDSNGVGLEKAMWTISRIDEADYGCEERLTEEPLMLLLTTMFYQSFQTSSRWQVI